MILLPILQMIRYETEVALNLTTVNGVHIQPSIHFSAILPVNSKTQQNYLHSIP